MHVDLEKAKASLPDLLEAARHGEEVVLTRDEQPVAKIVSLMPEPARPRFGSASGLVTMADDFDAPLEDFNEYMR